MSLDGYNPYVNINGFPRVSGDEPPGYGGLPIGVAFSPRERG